MKRRSKVIISLILMVTLSLMLVPETFITSVDAAAINEDDTGKYHLVIESDGFQIVGGGNGAELKKDTKELRVYVEDNKGNRYTPYYVSCSTMYGTSENFSIDASFDFDERNKLVMTIKGASGSKFWLIFDHVYFYTDDDLCEHVLYTDDNSERYYVTLTEENNKGSDVETPVNGNGTSVNGTPIKNNDMSKNNSSTTTKSSSVFTQGAYEYGNVSTKNKEVTLCGVKSGVTNVNVPSTVTYQGVTYKVKGISLSGNKKIKKVVIGKNVTDLFSAFDGCTALKKVTFARNSKLKTIRFFAFHECKALKKIKLPSTLKYIRSSAFCKSGLTSVTIPKNVEIIGPSAFEKCKNLKKVVIGNEVQEIGDSAFSGCKKLQKVTIGTGVMKIKKYAFGFCKSLKSVRIKTWFAKFGEDSFYGSSKKIVLTVPKECKAEYRAQVKKAGLPKTAKIK